MLKEKRILVLLLVFSCVFITVFMVNAQVPTATPVNIAAFNGVSVYSVYFTGPAPTPVVGYEDSNICDGDRLTYWVSEDKEGYIDYVPNFLYLDLGENKDNIHKVSLYFADAEGVDNIGNNGHQWLPRKFQLYYADNSGEWFPLATEEYYPYLPKPIIEPVMVDGVSFYKIDYIFDATVIFEDNPISYEAESFRYVGILFLRKGQKAHTFYLNELEVWQYPAGQQQ